MRSTRRRAATLFLVGVPIFAAQGCQWGTYDGAYTGGPNGPNITVQGSSSVSAAGARVTSDDGNFIIDVPPGAVNGDPITISIRNAGNGGGPTPTVGTTYDVGPKGYVFAKAVSATFVQTQNPGPVGGVLVAARADEATQPFVALAVGGSSGGTSFGLTRTLGNFALVRAMDLEACGCNPGCDSECRMKNGCGNGASCDCSGGNTLGYTSCYRSCSSDYKDACTDCVRNACRSGSGDFFAPSTPAGGLSCQCAGAGPSVVAQLEACVDQSQGQTLSCSQSSDAGADGGSGADGTHVSCNRSPRPCNRPSEYCCLAGATMGCAPELGSDAGLACTTQLHCDEAADCAPGNVCCAGSNGSVCANSCSSVQLCRTDQECKKNPGCVMGPCGLETCGGQRPPFCF